MVTLATVIDITTSLPGHLYTNILRKHTQLKQTICLQA